MILFLFTSLFFASAQDCPVQGKMPDDLSPATIKGYLQTNKTSITSPRDFVCCLARDQNVEIAIAQQSIAAQSSDPENPRVLMIMRDASGNVKSIMSINSGAAHLPQRNSVEMMYNNQGGKKLELYDIDFSAERPMSGKNPETCMGCHGTVDGSNKYGPRPIFDTHPWSRFVGSETNNRCENMKRLNKGLEAISLKALAEKPVYSCIKDKPRIELDPLEQTLAGLNNRKIALSLQSTADYAKFKYANVAIDICPVKIDEWIPKEVLATMNQTLGLSPAMAKAKNVDQILANITAAEVTRQQQSMQEDKRLQNFDPHNMNGKTINYERVSDSSLCKPSRASAYGEKFRSDFDSISPLALQRYLGDDLARDADNGSRRFLFESRGIDIAEWQMLANPGYNTSTSNLWVEIVKQEPRSSELSKLLYPILAELQVDRVIKTLPQDKTAQICEALRRLSYTAFGKKPSEVPESTLTVEQ